MSAQVVEHHTDEVVPEAREVEVRRRGAVTGAVGVAGCLVAVAWFVRATAGGSLVDWAVSLVMGAVGVVHLLALVDARTPLLVADEHGIRVRRGRSWHGVTWRQVARVEHQPRRGLLHDGALVVRDDHDDADVVRVPLTLTTRVVGTEDLTVALRDLAGPSVDVREVEPPAPAPTQHADAGREDHDHHDPHDDEHDAGPDRTAPVASPAADRERSEPVATIPTSSSTSGPAVTAPAEQPGSVASATPLPQRELGAVARADVVLGPAVLRLGEDDAPVVPGTLLPEARELRREGSVNLVEDTVLWRERVGSRTGPEASGNAVAPLVVDDHAAEPVQTPVIGPELGAARTRLGLSVDQLADRTRIRPHVIESIEVDDFAPCGGDFYARGHLRTLARVLGVDVGPLLTTYDAEYADAPIDARRVFEAELATGAGGAIRSTRGGPNWSVLVAAVMTVVLVWSLVQLFSGSAQRPDDLAPVSPQLNSSGGVDNGRPTGQGAAVPVVLTAAGGGAEVVVRSGTQVVFDDQLAFMQTVALDVAPPVRVRSSDGGLRVSVDGVDQGALGETGQEAEDIFVP